MAPPPGLEAMCAAKVEPQACKGKQSSLAAPPGLEAPTLAKALAPSQAAALAATAPAFAPIASLAEAEAQSHPGLWVNAVLAASPHLTPEGLHHALAIVDKAIRNAQHAKALDELIGSADQSQWCTSSYIQSAACLRAQISNEQLHLLGELQQLSVHYSEPEVVSAAVPMGIPASTATYMENPALVAAPVAAPAPAQTQTPTAKTPKASAKAGKTSERAGEKPSSRQAQTLSTSLQLLSHENPDCLFIVRHINKLGFKASRTLKRHYSAYGAVVRVLVAHSTVRQHGSPDSHARRRPSSLGFLQMASPEAAKAILAAGPEQEVDGAVIRIQKFERQQVQAVQEEEQADEQSQFAFERYTSSGSDNSLATVSTGLSEDFPASKGSSVDVPAEEAEEDE